MRGCTFQEVHEGGIYLIDEQEVLVAMSPANDGFSVNKDGQVSPVKRWVCAHLMSLEKFHSGYIFPDEEHIQEVDFQELPLFMHFPFKSEAIEHLLKTPHDWDNVASQIRAFQKNRRAQLE